MFNEDCVLFLQFGYSWQNIFDVFVIWKLLGKLLGVMNLIFYEIFNVILKEYFVYRILLITIVKTILKILNSK